MIKNASLRIVAAVYVASAVFCARTEDVQQAPDSSHAIPADCIEGESRCVVNLMQRCVGRQFITVHACDDTCDPIDGCGENDGSTSSYIWISNTEEGTLSKVNTRTAHEEARYYTCAYSDIRCDPSRTSVNLHGDAVVTNRGQSTWEEMIPSSVTKYAASIEDCIDHNGNGEIDTSSGPNDVRHWGEDECMIWNQLLPNDSLDENGCHGARATAWNGSEDTNSGYGGSVWIGTCPIFADDVRIYRLNGDTGEIAAETIVPGVSCAYGGAVDSGGNFWFFGRNTDTITKVDAITLETSTTQTSCGYGITVDREGRVWTGGRSFGSIGFNSCVARYDPLTGVEDVVGIPANNAMPQFDDTFLRGIAIGTGKTEGSVFAAETYGVLYQINQETMQIEGDFVFTPDGLTDIKMIGVAVDYKGFVWTVASSTNQAYKYDVQTGEYLIVDIGLRPYTYSDMTGVQLRNVIVR